MKYTLIRNPILRHLVFAVGVVSVGLGLLGAFLPVLPTTPFILLAAWCFVRSSQKAHDWLYRQPFFGPALQDWEENRAIARKTKIIAISMIMISLTVMWFKVSNEWVRYFVTALLAAVSAFIVTRNESTKK